MEDQAKLCARGCGFYGSSETRGLCSKCYTAYLKEVLIPETKLEDHIIIIDDYFPDYFSKSVKISAEDPKDRCSGDKNTEVIVIKKNRCDSCKKKVGLLGFNCKCGGQFCTLHRLPEKHSCTFDYKKYGKLEIKKLNPVLKAEKMVNRV